MSSTHYRSRAVCDLVEARAGSANIDSRTLGVRSALHLPQFADNRGNVLLGAIKGEIDRQATSLQIDFEMTFSKIGHPEKKPDLSEARFGVVDKGLARLVFENLHFLKAWRPSVDYYGLFDPRDNLIACCGVAELNSPRLSRLLVRSGHSSDLIAYDLCRVYTMPWAPRNSVSMLLSKVCRVVHKSKPRVDLMYTSVDPNVGFTGASYRSANWLRAAALPCNPYRYIDGNYRTLGQIELHYGTLSSKHLGRRLKCRYSESICNLERKEIYLYPLTTAARVRIQELAYKLAENSELAMVK